LAATIDNTISIVSSVSPFALAWHAQQLSTAVRLNVWRTGGDGIDTFVKVADPIVEYSSEPSNGLVIRGVPTSQRRDEPPSVAAALIEREAQQNAGEDARYHEIPRDVRLGNRKVVS
jgi:hypothetical protein